LVLVIPTSDVNEVKKLDVQKVCITWYMLNFDHDNKSHPKSGIVFKPWFDLLILVPYECIYKVRETRYCFMKLGISLKDFIDLIFKILDLTTNMSISQGLAKANPKLGMKFL